MYNLNLNQTESSLQTKKGTAQEDIDFKLASLLLEIAPQVMQEIRLESRAHRGSDLTLSQFRVLANIWRKEKTNNELAEDLGLSVAAMSRLVQTLCRKGMVLRLKNPKDRRECHIRPTKKGFSKFEEIRKKSTLNFAKRFSVLTMEEKKTLQSGFHIIEKAIFGKK